MNKHISLDEVKSLKRQGKLIPFIGAGFSRALGLPLGDDLIDMMAEDLGFDGKILRLHGTLEQIAQYYSLKFGGLSQLRSKLDKKLYPSDDSIKASGSHMALSKCNFPLIYTTNYDEIIERTMKLTGKDYEVIARLSDIYRSDSAARVIVKFHGSFNKDDATLILTEDSFLERLEFESALDLKLRSDTLGKTLLFIGYSFRDINLRYMLYKLNKLRIKEDHRLTDPPIGIMTAFSVDEISSALYADRNVEVYPLDPVNKEKSVAEFLESII